MRNVHKVKRYWIMSWVERLYLQVVCHMRTVRWAREVYDNFPTKLQKTK